jgi:putative transcriptional regulator
MTSRTKYKSSTLASLHEAATDLHEVGTIGKTTMREFDEACIATPAPMAPEDIQRLRQRLRVSQPVFARYLNTTESTVAKWESGAKRPSGMALELLHVARKQGLRALT